MTKLVLFRNNPKVYLTINHGDFSIVNPRTNLSRTEPRGGMGGGGGGGGTFLICIMDPICVDKKKHVEIGSILGMENQK